MQVHAYGCDNNRDAKINFVLDPEKTTYMVCRLKYISIHKNFWNNNNNGVNRMVHRARREMDARAECVCRRKF